MAITDAFLYTQLFVTPTYPTQSFAGKTVIVTGSNTGLGKEAARHLARLNADKVILAVRNLKAGEEAKQDIERTTKRTGAVEVWKLDLGSYASVKEFAKKASSELERIDYICCNAGIVTEQFKIVEKDESTVTVNVVSNFLLALLMMPKLDETAKKFSTIPTINIVSSEVHGWCKFPQRDADSIFDALSDEKNVNMSERYPESKLLEVLVIRQIAPTLQKKYGGNVTLNMLNPGLCHSTLAREIEGWVFWAMKKLLARTTEVGGRTLVAAGTAGPESHGKYMSDGQIKDWMVIPWVQSAEGDRVGKQVWKELKAKLEAIEPGVTEGL